MLATHAYSFSGFQDPVSALTHLLAAPVFLWLGYFLFRRGRGDRARLCFLGVFVFASVLLLTMSGLYHMMTRDSTARFVMERLDHGAIFVLIAGTFTATYGILYRGVWRWGPLILVWTCAVAGITLKTVFFLDVPEWFGLSLFLGLGWLGMFSAIALWWRFDWPFIRPLIWGGIAYTMGALLEFWCVPTLARGIIGPHEFYHLLVLAGLAFHWRFVFRFAAGTNAISTISTYSTELAPPLVVGVKRHSPAESQSICLTGPSD